MSVTTLDRPKQPVPKEFLGRARLVLQAIALASDQINTAAQAVFAPLGSRCQRNQPLSAADLKTARDTWKRLMPEYGLLSSHIEQRIAPKRLQITELRVSSGQYHKHSWNNDVREHALMIKRVTLVAEKHHAECPAPTIVVIGLHALARWFQRSPDTSEARLFSDLHQIARRFDDLLETASNTPDRRWHCRTQRGRAWWGEVRTEDRQLLVVDTYK